MGGIPVISELIDILIGFWNNSPPELKFLIFIGMAGTFVWLFQMIFDSQVTFGICPICYTKPKWEHKAFVPQECIDANKIVLQSGFNTRNGTMLEMLVYGAITHTEGQVLLDILNSSAFKINESNCYEIATCITANARWHDIQCEPCECSYLITGDMHVDCIDESRIYTEILPIFKPCSAEILSTNMGNISLIDYCVYNMINTEVQKQEVQDAFALANSDKCKNAGFDYLNTTYLWGGTLLIGCIMGTIKVFHVAGVFK